MKEKQAYLFFGQQGSGKGTQAKKLIEYYATQGKKAMSAEAGIYFRGMKGTYTSDVVKETIDAGNMLPDNFPIWAFTSYLIEQYTGEEVLIFDGVARTVGQSEALVQTLSFYSIENPIIVDIDVSDDWSVKRITERAEKESRADDTEDSVRKRLSWYKEKAIPAMNVFKDNPAYKYLKINGEQTIEEVHQDIMNGINQ